VREHPALLWLAILGFAATFLGNPVLTFLPLFAQDVLHGDVSQYTHLMSSAGAGAVAGALVVAWRGRFPHMGRTVLLIQAAFGAIVVLFAMTRAFWLNAGLLFAAGACMVMVFATLSSLVQLNAPNEMRGRVMSLYMVAFRGGMPLGSLASGWLATMTSAPTVLTVNGLVLSAVALVVLANNKAIREL
jgi:predicted MFS family arabinose efflux permease